MHKIDDIVVQNKSIKKMYNQLQYELMDKLQSYWHVSILQFLKSHIITTTYKNFNCLTLTFNFF